MIKLAMFDLDGTLIRSFLNKEPCDVCKGTGLDPRRAKCIDAKPAPCERCNGRKVRLVNDGHYARIDWLPNRERRLKEIARRGTDIVICTNQTGVHWGYQTRGEVEEKLNRVHAQLDEWVGTDAAILVLACLEPGPCRKPNPGMLDQAMNEFNVKPWESIFVGDMDSDRDAARRAHVAYADARGFFEFALPAAQYLTIGGR